MWLMFRTRRLAQWQRVAYGESWLPKETDTKNLQVKEIWKHLVVDQCWSYAQMLVFERLKRGQPFVGPTRVCVGPGSDEIFQNINFKKMICSRDPNRMLSWPMGCSMLKRPFGAKESPSWVHRLHQLHYLAPSGNSSASTIRKEDARLAR